MMMALSVAVNNHFVIVESATRRYNQKNSTTLDPIEVAQILVKQGYKITAIPEKKVEIQSSQDGTILDKKQIERLVTET